MIERLLVCRARGTDPYENLALEEALLDRVRPGELILYLWQNERTVVIGRNQNPWKECRTALLAEEGGRLARRLSGGGAVFHDLGNLNFTFLMAAEDYDLPRQLTVLERACQSLGIPAQRSGRNDLLADGRKFSGNAFYKHNGKAYHHGTLMVDVDLEKVQRYLSPSRAKLAAKGVDSVRSRVVNLREFVPCLTIAALSDALTAALAEVYAEATGNRQQATGEKGSGIRDQGSGIRDQGSGIRDQGSGIRDQGTGIRDQGSEWMRDVGAKPPKGMACASERSSSALPAGPRWGPGAERANIGRPPEGETFQSCHSERSEESVPPSPVPPSPVLPLDVNELDLRTLTAKYASDAWLFGQKLPFTASVEDRFPWGGIEIQLNVNEGVIRAARVYTDAMDETLAGIAEEALTDCPFQFLPLSAALGSASLSEQVKADLLSLLRTAL